MIGTGNARVGALTLSTGTVMALAAMSAEPAPRGGGVAMHYGFLPDTHVMLSVVEAAASASSGSGKRACRAWTTRASTRCSPPAAQTL